MGMAAVAGLAWLSVGVVTWRRTRRWASSGRSRGAIVFALCPVGVVAAGVSLAGWGGRIAAAEGTRWDLRV